MGFFTFFSFQEEKPRAERKCSWWARPDWEGICQGPQADMAGGEDDDEVKIVFDDNADEDGVGEMSVITGG